MRAIHRFGTLIVLGTLVVLPSSLPALAQNGSATSITHRQSVRTEMSPAGEVEASRIFTQLTVQGDGRVIVVLPDQSTDGLRNLEGFGGPATEGDSVTFVVDADGEGVAERTVATNTADMPIDLQVSYRLDGEVIEPEDLVGRSGQVEVTFTVRNTTAEPTEIEVLDGKGEPQTETVDVAVPIVGSISLELDSRFVDIEALGASVAGNGRGATFVSWSLVLFSPVGSEEQTVSYRANVTDAIVPSVVAQFLPVDSTSFPSLDSVQETFGGVADGLRELTAGGVTVDDNVQLLANGAAQLLDGLGQLSDGADQLETGLNERAAPGTQELAEGTGEARSGGRELADGLRELSGGAERLSGGLTTARSGSGELAAGIEGLAAGIGQPGHTAADETVIGGINSLRAGIAALPATAEERISDGLKEALNGILRPQLVAGVESGLTDGLQSTLRPGLVAGVEDGLRTNLDTTLQGVVRPQIVEGFRASAAPGLKAGIEGELFAGMQPALAGALVDNLGLDEATAGAIAAGYFDAFRASGATTAFADGAAASLAAGLDASLQPAFTAAAQGFAAGFARGVGVEGGGFDASLRAAFDQFSAGFTRGTGISGGGFDASLQGAFDTFAVEFAAGYREGLDASLREQALPGFDRLLAGLDNPSCDTANPTDAGNPCGIRQILQLLGAGSRDLAAGLVQLDDGGKQLAEGTDTAVSGANRLAGGLGDLDDGANRLAEGLEDAGDGAQELAEGLDDAEDGGGQIAEGTQRLSDEGTSALVDGASDAAVTPAIAVEHAKAADARGRAGEGLPYGTADGAVASAVYQFELAGIGGEDDSGSTALRVLVTLLAFGVAGGLGVVIHRRLV